MKVQGSGLHVAEIRIGTYDGPWVFWSWRIGSWETANGLQDHASRRVVTGDRLPRRDSNSVSW